MRSDDETTDEKDLPGSVPEDGIEDDREDPPLAAKKGDEPDLDAFKATPGDDAD